MAVLNKDYTITCDAAGKRYVGLDLDWDYEERVVHISMLAYVANALKRFHHRRPRRPQHQPHPHIKPIYGAKAQYAPARRC